MTRPQDTERAFTPDHLRDDDVRGVAHLAASPLRDNPERRRKRSPDPVTALHYQLAALRARGGLDAIVLVDDHGCLVAGAGAWPACEELAAYAPLLERRDQIVRKAVSRRIDALSSSAESLTFDVDGAEVVLCGAGGSFARGELLESATAGIRRILRAA